MTTPVFASNRQNISIVNGVESTTVNGVESTTFFPTPLFIYGSVRQDFKHSGMEMIIMPKITLEICCGSAEDVIQSKQHGADRVELNSCLFFGGLTPSIGELKIARATDIEIIAMVRPRTGGFCYTKNEFETMKADAKCLLNQGADGIAFGFLKPDGTIDEDRCQQMLAIIGDRVSVFHRAFDVVTDWKAAMNVLCRLGVSRILTSGRHATALQGTATLKEMRQFAAGRIQILPGAGIHAMNAEKIIRSTGCNQIHAGLRTVAFDNSSTGNPAIHFVGSSLPAEGEFDLTNKEKVIELRKAVDSL
jgi:copper homeostasis protein